MTQLSFKVKLYTVSPNTAKIIKEFNKILCIYYYQDAYSGTFINLTKFHLL